MSKDDFKIQYPGADDGGDFNQRGTGDFDPDWVQKEDIRVAEYFYVERKKTKLLLLSDGTKVYKDEAPSPEILGPRIAGAGRGRRILAGCNGVGHWVSYPGVLCK